MGTMNQMSLAFRAFHPALTAEQIHEEIGTQLPFKLVGSSSSIEKNVAIRVAEGFCCYEIPWIPSDEMNHALATMVQIIWPFRDALKSFIESAGRLEIYCSIQADCLWGDMLGSDTLESLGRLGLDLSIDAMLLK